MSDNSYFIVLNNAFKSKKVLFDRSVCELQYNFIDFKDIPILNHLT